MLIEKAFAKLYGCYSKLEGGQMSWALTAITGNNAVHFRRQDSGDWGSLIPDKNDSYLVGDDSFSDDDFFRFLQRLKRNGAFICCAGIAQANPQGLIDGHAYSVLSMKTASPDVMDGLAGRFFRLVQIRNPHGQGEWQGAWSDRSANWQKYPRVARELNEGALEDGAFWMQWEDFVRFWKGVQVVDCETNVRNMPMPDYDDDSFAGPLCACIQGCLTYWCCCTGVKRLYLGREGAQDVPSMKQGMDRRCGFDQDGFYCTYCERRTMAVEENDEEQPLLRT